MPEPRKPFDRWPSFLPAWWSLLVWLAMAIGTVWSVRHGAWGADHALTRVITGCLFVTAAVCVRVAMAGRWERHHPAWVTLAMTAGLASLSTAPSGLGEVPVFLAASRIPMAFSERSARWFTVAGTLATGLVIGFVSHSIGGLLAGVGVPFLAQRSLDRQALVTQRDRAEALLAEVQAGREAENHAAALRERGRIAREMHDVLAHSLAGLSLQLQAARAVAQKEGAGVEILEPLDRAAELARDGLAEARAAVGTLTDPTPHGATEIPGLIRRHPGHASLTVTGRPAHLTVPAGHAAYRAVQESLTNAARYAPGSPVRVTLAWRPGLLSVRVDDDGAAPGHPDLTAMTGHGSGLGLDGMRERLAAVGGSVDAGPHAAGWRVAFTVPTRESVPTRGNGEAR